GVAAGYMELADDYASGARMHNSSATVFRRKAADYRAMASPYVLRFAQNVEKFDRLGSGSVSLAFGLPRGSVAVPPVLAQISGGIAPAAGDEEKAVTLAIERNVVLSVCLAIGAPNDPAKAAETLGHASTITPRAVFGSALGRMLENASALYARDKLDEPD